MKISSLKNTLKSILHKEITVPLTPGQERILFYVGLLWFVLFICLMLAHGILAAKVTYMILSNNLAHNELAHLLGGDGIPPRDFIQSLLLSGLPAIGSIAMALYMAIHFFPKIIYPEMRKRLNSVSHEAKDSSATEP